VSPRPERFPASPSREEELGRIESELRRALHEIRYGSIEIVIHDSRVVQIERREKLRFDRQESPRAEADRNPGSPLTRHS
jgi:hypothetical protein